MRRGDRLDKVVRGLEAERFGPVVHEPPPGSCDLGPTTQYRLWLAAQADKVVDLPAPDAPAERTAGREVG